MVEAADEDIFTDLFLVANVVRVLQLLVENSNKSVGVIVRLQGVISWRFDLNVNRQRTVYELDDIIEKRKLYVPDVWVFAIEVFEGVSELLRLSKMFLCFSISQIVNVWWYGML